MSSALVVCLVVLLIVLLLFVGHANTPANWGSFWLNAVQGLNRIFCLYFHRLEADMLELPEGRPALLAPNHTSGLDPMLIAAISPRPVRFLIDREWYDMFGLHTMFHALGCIPVALDDRPQASFYEALKKLEAGDVVAIFPQGGLHPRGRLKRGVAKLAAMSGTPIIPLRVSGVGSPGSVVLSLLVPSRARLEVGEPIPVERGSETSALHSLQDFLVPDHD